jgi:hypothetical protein
MAGAMTMDEENTASSLTRHLGRQPKGVEGARRRHNAEVFVGAGDDPASVALRLAAGEGPALFQLDSGSSRAFNVSISNMTLADAPTAIHVRYCHGVHLSNLVIRDMSEYGIRVNEVCEGGLFVVNNTLVNCRRGITVEKVHGDMAKQFGDTRHFRSCAVENNIIYEYTDYGIMIGQSTGTNEQQAQAWNPLADNPLGEGNPIIPVRNNWVWGDSATSPTAFMGTNWYRNTYRLSDEVDHQERFQDPQIQVNYKLQDGSPASTAGSLYRLDVLKKADGFYYGKRRGLGAFESSNPDVYNIQLTN